MESVEVIIRPIQGKF